MQGLSWSKIEDSLEVIHVMERVLANDVVRQRRGCGRAARPVHLDLEVGQRQGIRRP